MRRSFWKRAIKVNYSQRGLGRENATVCDDLVTLGHDRILPPIALHAQSGYGAATTARKWPLASERVSARSSGATRCGPVHVSGDVHATS